MAKKGSSRAGKDAGRRAVVEQMRREQQAKERRKTFLLIGAAVLVGALIIGTAVWQLLEEQESDDRDLVAIGAPAADAGCRDVTTKDAGEAGEHRPVGEGIVYPDSPPAFGPHWENFLQPTEVRTFYTADDRPEVERLVHSLEHGWTILWYDDTIADDDGALDDLRAIAGKFTDADATDPKLMVAPWTEEDGAAFPGDTHLASTHWSLGGTRGNPEGPQGVWEYCGQVSGEAVADFMGDYPSSDSPEAGAF